MKTNIQRICTTYIMLACLLAAGQTFADGFPIPDEVTLTVIQNNPVNSIPEQEIPEIRRANIAFQRVDRPEPNEARPEVPTPPEVTPPPATPPPPAAPRQPRRPRCVPRRRSR